MSANLQPALREKARRVIAALTPEQREEILIKCWMSHDARWFMAVAMSVGMEAAVRINQLAVREAGKAEVRRLARTLGLPAVRTPAEYLEAQEVLIALLGPGLLDYEAAVTGDDTCEMRIQRCFAYDNVSRAGVADAYECGIFPRVEGWLEALGLEHELTPPLGKCLKAQGKDCAYTIRLRPAAASTA